MIDGESCEVEEAERDEVELGPPPDDKCHADPGDTDRRAYL